ncbi:MAG TPA: hypothetical protein VH186_05845 [Chloroflexia bacterium]|nr:hypothetical protein [Chloroflexia bacterium]
MDPVTNFEKYTVAPGQWQDEPVMVLRDNGSGSIAMIAPGLGSNCVSWTIQYEAQEVAVIETPNSPQVLRDRASRAGVPVLFPFPGRVRDARYSYRGKEYQLPANDKSGVHHIHGVVLNTGWEVGEYGSSEEGASLTLQVGPQNLLPDFHQGYPFDFLLSLRFVLRERRLIYNITLENREKDTPIPFGFGIHPYFKVPLIPNEVAPDRSDCPVQISARTHWPAPDGIPTGPAQPLPEDKNFSEMRRLGTEAFDDMFGDAFYQDGWTVASYQSPGTGLETRIRADQNFQDWVLFTPPNRPSLAIEPYTCPPNAINSAPEGLPGSNLLTLDPGQTWQAQVVLEVL